MAVDRGAQRDKIRGLFIQELEDALVTTSRLVEQLGAAGDDTPEVVRELFRVAHNLKGAAQAAGIDAAAAAATTIEEHLVDVREGRRHVGPDLVAEVLRHIDVLADAHRDLTRGPERHELQRGAPAVPPIRALRVPADKLDSLADDAAELVGAVDRLIRAAADQPTLHTPLREVTRTSLRLAERASTLSFQPFSEACTGIGRVARDVAAASGKQVDVEIDGGAIEIDGALVTMLREVLGHLVRNAVDHGIERPHARAEAGKPAVGRVSIAATPSYRGVQIEVHDDGRGVDLGAAQAAAVAAGARVTDDTDVLFEPGVTTASQVTAASGRGVGLDAVRTRITSVGGTVQLASTPGRGTTVMITIPSQVALRHVLAVRACDADFGLPVEAVRRVVRDRGELGAGRAASGEDVVAAAPLADVVAISPPASGTRSGSADRHLVIVESSGQCVALAVDSVQGAIQVIVKPVPSRLAAVGVLAGVAVLTNGNPMLVVDPRVCVEAVHRLAPRGASPVAGRRALVADDSPTSAEEAVALLEAAGYAVVTARDGAEAWETLERDGADLVVSDVEMPGVDGIELCRRVRSSVRFAHLPVILISGNANRDAQRRGLAAGANAYIPKDQLDGVRLAAALGGER